MIATLFLLYCSLHAVLSNANSNKDCNAHTLLTSEVAVEPLHIDRLMDACEVLPCSDTCIRTLEAVSKYLRGVCNLHSSLLGALHSANGVSDSASDFEARLSSTSGNMKMRRTASLGETRASNGSNTNANATTINNNNSTSMKQSTSNVFNIASPISFPANDAVYGDLTGTRIDRIYDWCDDILQEQLVATTAALGAGYRKLLEINTRHRFTYLHSSITTRYLTNSFSLHLCYLFLQCARGRVQAQPRQQ